jgi:hypothetical protein
LPVNDLGNQDDRAERKAHLIGRERDVKRLVAIHEQPVQLEDRLARQDHFLARQIGFDFDAGEGQPVTIGRHRAQFSAFDQQQQSVQVVAHILRRHAVLRLAQQLPEGLLRNVELPGLAFGHRHPRKVVGGKRLQAEAAPSRTHLQPFFFKNQAHFRPLGQ